MLMVGKIFSYVNRDYLVGDNKKYMNMYDKLSFWYDFGEKWIGLLRYGNTISEMRKNLMEHLEWKMVFLFCMFPLALERI